MALVLGLHAGLPRPPRRRGLSSPEPAARGIESYGERATASHHAGKSHCAGQEPRGQGARAQSSPADKACARVHPSRLGTSSPRRPARNPTAGTPGFLGSDIFSNPELLRFVSGNTATKDGMRQTRCRGFLEGCESNSKSEVFPGELRGAGGLSSAGYLGVNAAAAGAAGECSWGHGIGVKRQEEEEAEERTREGREDRGVPGGHLFCDVGGGCTEEPAV